MPGWNPNWNDVRWNYAVANQAANELRRVARRLDTVTAERVRLADSIRQEWVGHWRDVFNIDFNNMVREAAVLANELRNAASRIDHLSERARNEQYRRERERERWKEEKRMEERRKHKKGGGGGGAW